MKQTDFDLKPEPLFGIEIYFERDREYGGRETCRWFIVNQSWPEVRAFRETVFTHGFFLELAPGRGELIFPWDFRKILIDIQRKGWSDAVYEIKPVIKIPQ